MKKETPMHKSLNYVTAIAVFGVFAAGIGPAAAADAGAVLAACDRTPGCSYAQSKDGSIQGCSSQSGVCFNCDVDGKKECHQTLTRKPSNHVLGTFGGRDNVAGVLGVENPPTVGGTNDGTMTLWPGGSRILLPAQ
jgi:hypothetical protein